MVSGAPSKPANREFYLNIPETSQYLCDSLLDRSYVLSPKECILIQHPVPREVFASCHMDSALNHLVFPWLYKVIDPVLIEDAYSCRKGKGTSYGVMRLKHFMRSVSKNYTAPAYVLMMDISGYYISINRKMLLNDMLDTLERRRFMPCPNTSGMIYDDRFDFALMEWIIALILENDPLKDVIMRCSMKDYENFPRNKSMHNAQPGCGIILGDLVSQLLANFFLSLLDEYVKRVLKVLCYGRYVDDMAFVSNDPVMLREIAAAVEEFLRNFRSLKINTDKTRIIDIHDGVPFLGRIMYPFYDLPSERTVKAFRAAVWDIRCRIRDPRGFTMDEAWQMTSTIESYKGFMRGTQCGSLLRSTLNHPEIEYLGEVVGKRLAA